MAALLQGLQRKGYSAIADIPPCLRNALCHSADRKRPMLFKHISNDRPYGLMRHGLGLSLDGAFRFDLGSYSFNCPGRRQFESLQLTFRDPQVGQFGFQFRDLSANALKGRVHVAPDRLHEKIEAYTLFPRKVKTHTVLNRYFRHIDRV
jgi:hypothetical protein